MSMEMEQPKPAASELNGALVAAEPYMLSGYEQLARRDYERQLAETQERERQEQQTKQAFDPVYKGGNMQSSSGLWNSPTHANPAAAVSPQQQMEDQYGVYAQLREQMGAYGVQSWGSQRNGLDEEMVM